MSALQRTGRAVFSAASAGLLLNDAGRILLVHHGKSGRWVLPGGKAEWDEPPRATALREATEELGIPVDVGRLLVVNWLTGSAELWPGAANNPYAYPCYMLTWHITIDPEDVSRIEIPQPELLDFRWWDLEEATAQGGPMEPYNARNLAAAHHVLMGRAPVAYLES